MPTNRNVQLFHTRLVQASAEVYTFCIFSRYATIMSQLMTKVVSLEDRGGS
jgi:hypothetical protein